MEGKHYSKKRRPVEKKKATLVLSGKKQCWRGANLLFPVPAVMVSCADLQGRDNILTVAWAGTVCSDPAMLSISVRKERFSHSMILESGEFVVNLTTRNLAFATDYCGVRSGRDEDKWDACGLHRQKAEKVSVPLIRESPINLECKVKKVLELGTHDMFLAEIVAVDVDESLLNKKGSLDIRRADLISYAHGRYFTLGDLLGTFGYSVKKKKGK